MSSPNDAQDLSMYDVGPPGERAIAAARACSHNGKLFDDTVVWQDARYRDDAVTFLTPSSDESPPFLPIVIRLQRPGISSEHSTVGDLDGKSLAVRFDLGAHIPAIVLRIELSADKYAFVHIFGSNLVACEAEPPIRTITHDRLADMADYKDMPYFNNARVLQVMLKPRNVSRQTENTDACLRMTGAASAADIEKWKALLSAGRSGELTTAQRLLASISAETLDISIFVRLCIGNPTPEHGEEHKKFATYLTAVMWLSATLGNFWWFRSQTEIDWMDPAFPFLSLTAPPWQVSNSENPQGAPWAQCKLSAAWPTYKEAIFALRHATIAENEVQQSKLVKLFASASDMTVVLQLLPDKSGCFLARIHSETVRLGSSTPSNIVPMVGNRIMLHVMPPDAEPYDLPGQIVPEYEIGQTAQLCAVVYNNKAKPRPDHYNASLVSIDKTTTFSVLVEALFKYNGEQILKNPDTVLRFGPNGRLIREEDVKRLKRDGSSELSVLFGLPISKHLNQDYFKERNAYPGLMEEWQKYLAWRQPLLDSTQNSAAERIITSDTGNVIISGSARTGKTFTFGKILSAMYEFGYRVIVFTPNPADVQRVIEAFSACRNLSIDAKNERNAHSWMIYSGASTTAQLRTAAAQATSREEGNLAQEDYWLYLDGLVKVPATEGRLHTHSLPRRRRQYAEYQRTSLRLDEGSMGEASNIYLDVLQSDRPLSVAELRPWRYAQDGINEQTLKRSKLIFCTSIAAIDETLRVYPAELVIIDEAGSMNLAEAFAAVTAFNLKTRVVVYAGDPDREVSIVHSSDKNEMASVLQQSIINIRNDAEHQVIKDDDPVERYHLPDTYWRSRRF